jgi:hypothetical protein
MLAQDGIPLSTRSGRDEPEHFSGDSTCERYRLLMDWAIHESQIRFDIRAEREECEKLFKHPARVLQDRLVRRDHTDRTRQHAIPEWEQIYQTEARERRLLHQARAGAKRKDITMRVTILLNYFR